MEFTCRATYPTTHTKNVSNVNYFGPPLYVYSLKQRIEDGFLAPYRVHRIDLDKDLESRLNERPEVQGRLAGAVVKQVAG